MSAATGDAIVASPDLGLVDGQHVDQAGLEGDDSVPFGAVDPWPEFSSI